MKNVKYNEHYKNVREPQLIAALSEIERQEFLKYYSYSFNQQKEDLPNESWKQIPNFPKYEASTCLRIRNTKHGNILIPYLRKNYYLTVILRQHDKSKDKSWSRLMAETFIPNPENKREVNHINFIRIDNRLSNLEWSTPSENMVHSLAGQEYRLIKINQLDMDGNFIRQFNSIKEAGDFVGGRPCNIARTARGDFKYAYGSKWEFPEADSKRYRIQA